MTTLTLQPDAAAGKDCHIYSAAPAYNYGVNAENICGSMFAETYRALLQFDLSSIPATATIDSAVLTLTRSSNGTAWYARQMQAYRVLRTWAEGIVQGKEDAGATWNTYDGSNNWGTAGCANTTSDREAASIGAVTWALDEVAGVTHDITLNASKVQEWVAGSLANYGLLLQMDSEDSDIVHFAASDHATASYRPKLVIEYTEAAVSGNPGYAYAQQ